MISARLGEDLRLPGARTREQDAVAMLDEGGVAILCAREWREALDSALAHDAADEIAGLVAARLASAAVFGHGIYEVLARAGSRAVRAAAYVIEVDSLDASPRARVAAVDSALAILLRRAAPLGRADLASIAVDERLAQATSLAIG
jgi:hypothetical protein